MAADIETAGIAAIARGVLVGPGNTAPHLLGHHADVAIRGAHVDEIKHDVVYAGVDKELGWIGVVLGHTAPPGAAVHEHEDRRVRSFGGI